MVWLHCGYQYIGTRHHLDNFIPELLVSTDKKRYHIYQTLLKIIVHKPVLERPGRSQPRVRKRRPKAYPLLKQTRSQLRCQLQTV